ncbi:MULTISPECIES: ABC transporter ATP-binding protein [unclassified Pseudomonas]|uniref:ABC transporter ATP-binding protein n=1 Tax=unclassified Pseudomonas TaxID=196821 RepID=UPI00384AAC4D
MAPFPIKPIEIATVTASSAPVAIQLDKVSKRFGDSQALHDVSLKIHQGEFVTLIGPSGCGKTTLLNLLAGVVQSDQGEILIDGQQVGGTSSSACEVSLVSESASLARALSHRPYVLLLDEPFSGLEKTLRLAMQAELKDLQRRLDVTTVLVTHDQSEALSLSDRLVVMCAGRVHQIGPPDAIYRHPQDPFVARFVGDVNVLPGRYLSRDERAVVALGGTVLRMPSDRVQAEIGARVDVYLRPEHIQLEALGPDIRLSATVVAHVFQGDHTDVHLDAPALGPDRLRVRLPGAEALTRWPVGAVAGLHIDSDDICAFASEL